MRRGTPVLSRFVVAFLVVAAAIQIGQAQVVETSDKEDTTGMPRVVFIRPSEFKGSKAPAVVYCDLTKLAKLRNNTYFEIALSPGVHVCSTEMMETRMVNKPENQDKPEELSIEVKPGQEQWVTVHFRYVGWTHTTFRLTPEDPAKASKEAKHAQPVKPEEQFIRSIKRTPAGSTGN